MKEARPGKKKRKLLGEGYIWFYGKADTICLSKIPSGFPKPEDYIKFKTHGLGAWQKVKLYAEYE